MEQLQKSLAERVPQMVGVGYLRFEHPGFKEAIEELCREGIRKVVVSAFLLETMLYWSFLKSLIFLENRIQGRTFSWQNFCSMILASWTSRFLGWGRIAEVV